MFWIFFEYLTLKLSHMSQLEEVSLFQGQISQAFLWGIKHACCELSAFRESRTDMGPAESMLEIYFLGLWRLLSMASLGTTESRMKKQSRKLVQVKDRVCVQVLTWPILCMFSLIWCLSFGSVWFVIYDFLFF